MADLPALRLLGTVQLWRDGEQLELGGPLQRALLACLALNVGRVVSREKLTDALWGLEPPPRAARSLETKVSRLRASLRQFAPIVARDGGYVLDAEPDQIDAVRFAQALTSAEPRLLADPGAALAMLREGLALWRGPALEGLPEGALAAERTHLDEQRRTAIEARIEAELALGEGSSLVAELQGLRLENPGRERVAEQLMVALYRCGRQAEALETYRVTYRTLRDEFGLTPGPRLRELEQAILRHDPSLGEIARGSRQPARRRRTSSGGPRRRPALAMTLAAVMLAALAAVTAGGAHRRREPIGPGLILVNAATGAVRADVRVDDSQGITRFGYGRVWTIGDNGVMSEVDPRSGTLVASIPVGVQAGGMAIGAGGIWVTDRNGPDVIRIDPGTGAVNLRARLSMHGLARPEPNGGIAVDAGSLWVARGPEAIDRLSPTTLRLERRIRLYQHGCGTGAGIQCAVAAAGDHVWVAGGAGAWLAEIDASTERARLIDGLRPALCCIAASPTAAWVAEAHDVAQITLTGRVVRRYPVASAAIGDVSFDGRYAWATADTTGELLRIDPLSQRVRVTRLGNLLISTAASRGIVTASALPLPSVVTHDLGPRVLRVGLAQDALNPTDPAVARAERGSGTWQWQVDEAICAPLYLPRRIGSGQPLEPELASGPPVVSRDGRRWTIPIRTDFRFSPPLNRAVTVQDVESTVKRALSPELGPGAPAAAVLAAVVGVSAYRRGTTTDLRGLETRNGALQITTRRPVPDLPERLSLPYFCVLPAGTPTPPGGYQDPLSTAGPYYLAEHSGGAVAVLRPNPGYAGPRPRRLDAIVFDMNVPDAAGRLDVRRVQLDVYSSTDTVLGRRVACRTFISGLPGADLAALCLRP